MSHRLTTSPCALVAGQYGWSVVSFNHNKASVCVLSYRTGNMERIMKSQAYNRAGDSSTR